MASLPQAFNSSKAKYSLGGAVLALLVIGLGTVYYLSQTSTELRNQAADCQAGQIECGGGQCSDGREYGQGCSFHSSCQARHTEFCGSSGGTVGQPISSGSDTVPGGSEGTTPGGICDPNVGTTHSKYNGESCCGGGVYECKSNRCFKNGVPAPTGTEGVCVPPMTDGTIYSNLEPNGPCDPQVHTARSACGSNFKTLNCTQYQQVACTSSGIYTCINSSACGYDSYDNAPTNPNNPGDSGGNTGGTGGTPSGNCPDGSGSVIWSAYFRCPNGDTNGDLQCSEYDQGATVQYFDGKYTTEPSDIKCWQIDFYNAGPQKNWDAYCGHLGRPDLPGNCPPIGEPQPSAPPEETPPPTVGPMCLNITMNPAAPKMGDQVTFTCGIVQGVNKYEFRVRMPNGSVADLAESSSGSNVSQPLTISTAGTYQAQCRVCTGSSCSEWEM